MDRNMWGQEVVGVTRTYEQSFADATKLLSSIKPIRISKDKFSIKHLIKQLGEHEHVPNQVLSTYNQQGLPWLLAHHESSPTQLIASLEEWSKPFLSSHDEDERKEAIFHLPPQFSEELNHRKLALTDLDKAEIELYERAKEESFLGSG